MAFFGAAAGALRGLQGRQELQDGREPIRRDLGQRPLDGPSHRPWHAGAERGERRHRVEYLARQHREHVGSGERRLTRQQLVEDAGEAVLVGPGVDLALASGLLGTHVGGGPHAQAGLGQPAAGREARGARDAEVRDQGVALREQDVLGLHVAMNQPFPVGVVERFAGLPHQAEGLRHRERALASEPLAQGLAVHVRHDVERPGRGLVGCAGVEQGEDVGVLEPREDLDLEQEALGGLADDDLRAQDLDGDGAVVFAVARQVHHRHPAPAQLSVDRIAVAHGDRLEDGSPTSVKHAGKLRGSLPGGD